MIPNQDLLNHDLILIEALLCLLEENRKAYETLFVDGRKQIKSDRGRRKEWTYMNMEMSRHLLS